jgi:hypothetical protein
VFPKRKVAVLNPFEYFPSHAEMPTRLAGLQYKFSQSSKIRQKRARK